MKQAGKHWYHQHFCWSAHLLVWLEAIYLSPVKSMSVNKMAQLLTTPKTSWMSSKENPLVTVGSLLAFAIPWLQPVSFSCGSGSNSKFEGSSLHPLLISKQQRKISMQWYLTNNLRNSSNSRSGVRLFCLQMAAILSTFWHPCRLAISQY